MFGRLGYRRVVILGLIVVLLISNLTLLVSADSNITISGRLVVRHQGDSSGAIVPIPNARVEVYDEESIEYFGVWGHLPWLDTYLGATYTDSDGYFSVTVNNDDGSTILGDEKGRDIYLKFMASNQVAEVRNDPGFLLGSLYSFNTGTNKDMADGAHWDMGDVRPDGATTQIGFEILYIAGLAWNHIKETTGQELSKVNIFIDDTFTTDNSYYLSDRVKNYLLDPLNPLFELSAQYYPQELIAFFDGLPEELGPVQEGLIRDVCGLHLFEMSSRESEDYYRVVFHEYGHHIMYDLFDGGPPSPESGAHALDSEFNPQHAWVEGWAEFYPYVVSERYGINIVNTDIGIPNIEALNSYFDYTDDDIAWDSVEGNVASILWDIIDPSSDTLDSLNIGFSELANLLMTYDPEPDVLNVWPLFKDHVWNIHDVFSAFQSRYDSDKVGKLWVLLNARGIAEPDDEVPSIPTSYTSSHNSVIPLPYLNVVVDLHGAHDDVSGLKYYYKVYHEEPESLNWPGVWAYPEGTEAYFLYNWESSTSPHIEYQIPETTGYYYPAYYIQVVTFDNAGNYNEKVFEAGPFLVADRPMLEFEGVMTNSIGDLVLSGTSTLQVNDPPPSKGWTNPFLTIGDLQNEDDFEFSEVLNFLERPEGYYEIKIYQQLSPSKVEESYSLLVDKTPPTIDLSIGGPRWDENYVSSKTVFTISANDADAGVKSIQYSFDETNWIDYSNPFNLLEKSDGSYTIYYRAEDYVGNVATKSASVQLDNSVPTFEMIIDSPKVTLDKIHVTSDTKFSISSSDSGSGLDRVEYRLFNTGSDWISFSDPFTITGPDGDYTIDYRCSDNLGNVQTKTLNVILDNFGPQINLISPIEGFALQDVLDVIVDSQDPSGVTEVKMSIKDADNQVVSGFEALNLVYDSDLDVWVIELDSLQLQDGKYFFELSSVDGLGNTAVATLQFSVRNWAVLELLPSTQDNKAGRTMPIKFCLRIDAEVDPTQPFVYNENLVIQVFQDDGEDPLQVSTFGDTSTDYRINGDTQLYITNFATPKKTTTTYTVEIFAGGLPVDTDSLEIGGFTFSTTK